MLKYSLFVFATLVAASPSAQAADEVKDVQTRFERFYVNYTILADGTHTEEREIATKILDKRAVLFAKQGYLGYSTSVQKADVLDAYTLKADGRRLDVAKNSYQLEVNSGAQGGAAAFSDFTTLTIIFPDVAANDTTVLRYKITTTEPIFPKHFSVDNSFPRNSAFDDVRIRLDAPVGLYLVHDARQLTEAMNQEKDGRKLMEWTYSNKSPTKSKRRNFSVYEGDEEPGLSLSTFRSYGEIATAYGDRATPKAKVTPRIQKLADEIVGAEKVLREQARLLYEWVAVNITYAGNCVGIGAVVPRDIDFVLDNKMGDCKDHATLLQALLHAKGIVNIQALVNAGGSYRLARAPVVSAVNHVINYIPAWDLYLDSTSNSTPFGMLPFSDADKPVLWVTDYKEGTRTPRTNGARNLSVVKNSLKINAEGGATGEVDVTEQGVFAVGTRERMRFINRDFEEDSLKRLFDRNNAGGGGKMEKDDPTALLDTYHYKVTFNSKEYLPLPGAGATPINSMYYTGTSIQSVLSSANYLEEEARQVTCYGAKLVEEHAVQFPKSVKILHVPKNVSLTSGLVTYQATYSMKANLIRVWRSLEDRTPGNVCDIATQRALRDLAKKALLDVRAQVLYR